MHYTARLAAVSVSLFAFTASAFAQDVARDTAADRGYNSGEIVVQARRRDESVQDVPSVVNAVTSETIADLNLRKVEDIAAIVPGLSLTPNANGIGSVTTIRGVNFDVNQSGNAATVEFYLNDAPTTSNAVLQGMFDIAQIEVLRGPQGTLKGRASPSGSISIATRRPDMSEAGVVMNGTVNDINGWNLNGAINVPIIGDKLAVRIAGLVSEDDGNRVHAVSNSRDLRNQTQASRFSVRADPFDGVLLLDFLYQNLGRTVRAYDAVQSVNQFGPTSGAIASPITISARDRLAVEGLQRISNQNFDIYNWGAQLSQFGQRLVYVGQVTEQHLESFVSDDKAGIFTNPTAPNGVRLGLQTTTKSKNTSHEIRLQNEERIAGMFDYVVGYLRYKTNSNTFPLVTTRSSTASPAPAPGVSPVLTGLTMSTSERFSGAVEESIFGNVTAHIGANTELAGGIRHIWYDSLSGLRALVGGTLIDVPAYHRETSPEATIYSASLKHNFTEDLMAYASFGTSWRPDTIVAAFPSTTPTPFQQQFLGTPPETSKSFEVGIKSNWLDNRLLFNVTAYYQKFKNYPYRTPGVFGVYYIDTSADPDTVRQNPMVGSVPVEVKGVEAEISYTPNENFMVGAVLSYADGKIKDGLLPCLDLTGDGVPDAVTTPPTLAQLQAATGADGVSACSVTQRASISPPFSATMQAQYNQPLSDRVNGYIRGLYTFKGNSQNDPNNPFDEVKAYGILNLYAGVRDPDGAWDLSIYGKNITNTFRVLSRTNGPLTTNTNGRLFSYTNYYGISVTDPREFGVNLRVAFGSR